ncbi:response regulator transcription factor [Herbiconiux sp. UC225_62]|uniref:helix-turn-helix transcriptional regulator n=1 Tax=Herbiconiux sp. UC225_62 TaxID=3350168 RepID=UPI0036D2E557
MTIRSGVLDRDELTSADYDRIFGVLADCDSARDLRSFREALLESLGLRFGFTTTTFFTGSSFAAIWTDPDPLETRSSAGMLAPYQDGWYKNEVFSSAAAVALLRRTRVAGLGELSRLPHPAQDYLDRYLYPGGFHAATALHLDAGGGRRAVVGIFKSKPSVREQQEIAALRRLAGPLNSLSRALAPDEPDSSGDAFSALAPRHQEVARLVAEGLSNAEIATLLNLTEGTVKKYVSAILAATRLRSRTQLALLVNTRGERAAQPHW